jgi:BlaI family penicillinase repressor
MAPAPKPLPMKHPLNLGLAEMAVLRYVAENAPVTVRDAAEYLADTKGQVRTTVLNSMERLRKKGFLRRRKADGVYQYWPVDGKGALFQRLLKGFVDAAFGGTPAPLVAYLAETGDMTEEELKVLARCVERLEAQE